VSSLVFVQVEEEEEEGDGEKENLNKCNNIHVYVYQTAYYLKMTYIYIINELCLLCILKEKLF